MMKALLLILLLLPHIVFSASVEEERAAEFAQEIIEKSNSSFDEFMGSNQTYKYDDLMNLLNTGDSPELITQTLEEFNTNLDSNKALIQKMISSAEANPQFAKRAEKSLETLKAKMNFGKVGGLIPSYCALFIGAYFSTRDLAYSSRAFFVPGSDEDKVFVDRMHMMTSTLEYGLPFLCLVDIYARADQYKEFVRDFKGYQRSRSNVNTLKTLVSELNADPDYVRTRKVQHALVNLPESKKTQVGLLVLEELRKEEAKLPKETIIEKFKSFLTKKRIDAALKKYSKLLDKDQLALLKSMRDNPSSNISAKEGKLLDIMQKMFLDLEDQFLQDLVKNGEGRYDQLKKELKLAQKNQIKNLKNFELPATTKLCMGAIGGNMLLHGHLAAIGPEKTIFDNYEDAWLRENRNNFAYLTAATISGACFSKLPYFIYQRRMGKLHAKPLLEKGDYKIIDEAIETAMDRYRSGERVKITNPDKVRAVNEIAKAEERVLKEFNISRVNEGVNRSEKVQAIIDDVKGGEDKLVKKITDALNSNDTQMFSELLESKDPKEFKHLIRLLESGDIKASKAFIENLDKNRFDLIKYLSALHSQVRGNPELLKKITDNLHTVKEEMKLKNIKAPTAQACMIALGTYIGTRDLFFSIRNSYIEKENDRAWADAMDAADALTGLGVVYLCLSDIIVHGKDVASYFKNVGRLKGNRENLQTLMDVTKTYQEDKNIQKIIPRLKVIPNQDKKSLIRLSSKIAQKIENSSPSEFPKLSQAWQKFLQSTKMERIFDKFKAKLSSEDRIILDRAINGGSEKANETKRALAIIDDFKGTITHEFEDWLKTADSADRAELIKELRALKLKQKQILAKHKAPGLGTKACFWGVGTILAGLGYHAAVGNKPNELDHKLEEEQRKHTWQLFYGAQAIFAGTCGLNVFYHSYERMQKKAELRNNLFLKNKTKDWEMIEDVLNEYEDQSKGKKTESKALTSSIKPKDIIVAIANRQSHYQYAAPEIVKPLKGAKKVKEKINRSLPDGKYNFDRKCIENFLKSSL